MFQLVAVTMTMPRENRQKMRWLSSGNGRGRLMDQAKMVEETIGPAAFASEPIAIERPLRVPRWEGSTALLVARETLMNTCCDGGEGKREGGRGRGVPHQGCPVLGAGAATSKIELTRL